jgi:sodium/pantothenate symporter
MIWVLLAAYMVFIVWVVARGAKGIKSMKDYATGSVSFSPYAVGLSLAAGMTSAATFIINPGFIAYYGISGFISMGVVLPIGALISLVIFSKKFRQIGNHIQAKTLSQWIGMRYQHKGFSLFMAILTLLLITFIVLICVGLTQILSKATGVDDVWMLLGIVAFTFGYMMFGGANSMVYTNAAQAIVMLIVAIILLSSGFNYFAGDGPGLFSTLKSIDPQLTRMFNPTSPLFRDFFEVIVCQLIVGIAIVCQPHIITRSLLLKSEQAVNKYLITGVLVQTLFFFVVFAGLYARIDFPSLVQDGKAIPLDAVMSTWVVSKFPAFVSVLLVLGMMAAGISTLEGLIQSLSTTITEDIIKPVFASKTENGLTVNKAVIFVLAVVAFFLSWEQLRNPDLSVGIFAQNGVYAFFSAAFVPVLFGIFIKKVPAYIPFAASVIAVVVHFSIYYFRLTAYMEQGTRNPGIASALAIVISVSSAFVLYAYYLNTQKKEALA